MLDLLDSAKLLNRDKIRTPFTRWADDLHEICGSFSPVIRKGDREVCGEARRIVACGIEFSHISNDLDLVRRDWEDVRRDETEQIFLVMQLEGSCGVEHTDRQSTLNVGDCILIDSTKPTYFHFGGEYSNHISMNLPRHMLDRAGEDDLRIASRISGSGLMAIMLRNLTARILEEAAEPEPGSSLRRLVVNTTRLAFGSGVNSGAALESDGDRLSWRLHLVETLIDRHLTNPGLSAKWLARKTGVSMRVLQLHFQNLDMTCTTFIRDKRLRLAHERLSSSAFATDATTIAEVAYSVGFNDLSYFNRCFRHLFDCRPSDLLAHRIRN